MTTITEPTREIPVIGEYDIVVAGGGPGGLPAAIAAARSGAKVLLIERYGFLGGMATAGLIGPILAHTAHHSQEPTIGGIPKEICVRMAEIGGAVPWEDSLKSWGVSFYAEALKYIADRVVEEAHISLRLHTMVVDAVREGDEIKALILESKSGREAVLGKVFVDATGDADVAFRAGLTCTKGRKADGAMQSLGSMFRIGRLPANLDEARKIANEKVAEAVERGELVLYNTSLGHQGSTIVPGELTANITRFNGDATSAWDLTVGEVFVRKMTWDVVKFWRENIPGLEDVLLIATATQIGIRETRQVVGDRIITGQDIVDGMRCEDSVARNSYWIDIHCPLGRVRNKTHLCCKECPNNPPCLMFEKFEGDLPGKLYPPDGGWCDIPYASIISQDARNLLTAGRCISADHQAMSALRVMGPCMAIGEAAGTAAAMAVEHGNNVRAFDVQKLRAKLTENGALV